MGTIVVGRHSIDQSIIRITEIQNIYLCPEIRTGASNDHWDPRKYLPPQFLRIMRDMRSDKELAITHRDQEELWRDFEKTATGFEARFATEENCPAYWIEARRLMAEGPAPFDIIIDDAIAGPYDNAAAPPRATRGQPHRPLAASAQITGGTNAERSNTLQQFVDATRI
jgi:hypothetical protein